MRSEGWQPSRVVDYVTREGLPTFASFREWLLIFATGRFIGYFNNLLLNKKFFLSFLWCSWLALRNHTGATQKTNFITDVSLVRNN